MSEVALFAFGSVVFMITTWATITFGLARIHQLQREDLEDSPGVREIRETGLTEVYVTRRPGDS